MAPTSKRISSLSDGLSPFSALAEALAAMQLLPPPPELRLLEDVLEDLPSVIKPELLVGDRAYDSDENDARLADKDIELIAAHKRGRKRPKTQDGRKLKRLKKRWVSKINLKSILVPLINLTEQASPPL